MELLASPATSPVSFTSSPAWDSAHPPTAAELISWADALSARERAVAAREARVARSNVVEVEAEADESKGFHKDHSLANYVRRGKYVKSLVFGALDGLTTSLAFLASTVAAGEMNVPVFVVAVIGASQLVGDAFSMGLGDFLSSLAEHDVASSSPAAAAACRADAARNGLVMFLSFLLFGVMPLLAYTPALGRAVPVDVRFFAACGLAVMCLFCLGAAKGRLEGNNVVRSGLTMLCTGSIASVLSYYTSMAMHRIADPSHEPGLTR